MRLVSGIGVLLALFSVVARASISELDLRRRFGEIEWNGCQKPPLPGTEPEDKRLRLEDFRQTPTLLTALSEYVYSVDKEYLIGMAELVGKSEQADLLSIFVGNAVSPYLAGLGYVEVKRRYLDVALENLACLNGIFGIKDLSSLKEIQLFQETALRFLAKSLHSARPMLSERQRANAAELVDFFGNVLAQGLTQSALAEVRAKLPVLEALELELAVNPFLRSRSAADLAVARFLKE